MPHCNASAHTRDELALHDRVFQRDVNLSPPSSSSQSPKLTQSSKSLARLTATACERFMEPWAAAVGISMMSVAPLISSVVRPSASFPKSRATLLSSCVSLYMDPTSI